MKQGIQAIVLSVILCGCVNHDMRDPLPHTVSVGGDVRTPGKYALVKGMTVRDAIDAAGGFTDYASAVRLHRGTNLVFRARGRRIHDGREPLQQDLQKGDVVFVERTY